MIKAILTYLSIFCYFIGMGQAVKPFTEPFIGEVFKIPKEQLILGYGDHIKDLPIELKVEWKDIHFPNRTVDEGLPNIPLTTSWGMIIKSRVYIPQKAYYLFSLESDDGSILWIDNKEVIDNDGDHKMTFKADTLLLKSGFHDIKIWYHQAYYNLMGFIFDIRYADSFPRSNKVSKTVTFQNAILFDFDKSNIRKEAIYKVDSLAHQLKNLRHHDIKILGHTDNLGEHAYNRRLSLDRAESIKKRFLEICECTTLNFQTAGIGETYPREKNDTEAGRQLNRRVEIVISPL